MSTAQVAEALYRAWVDRATGTLRCRAEGRETAIRFRDGRVVETTPGFAWQGMAPALVQAGRLELAQLDALWARGEAGAIQSETLEELGIARHEAASAQVLANVRAALRRADAVAFEAGDVEGEGVVSGARVVREAFAALPAPNEEPPWFRVVEAAKASTLELADHEWTWLQGFVEWRQATDATPAQRALLELLVRGGALESIPDVEMKRRREEERQRREEEERLRREEEERQRREEEERQRREEERQRREEEERQRREEEERLRREEEERQRREEEERQRREEEERQRREEEERARAERLRQEAEAAERAAHEERERIAAAQRAEEEARLRAEEEARLRAEEEARLRAEEEARLRAEEEARLRAEEEARLRAEEEARLRAEEEARLRAEEEARLRAEEEARLRAEEEARLRAEEEARLRAEEEARLRAEEEARLRAEEEARLRAEEEARLRAEEEARLRAEEEARLRAEEEARLRAEEEARLRAEEEARLRAEEEARLRAEEEARLRAEEEARLRAEEEARLRAEEEARLRAEEEARRRAEEEARLRAEEEARLRAEEEARLRAEEEARLRAEEEARLRAEEEARLRAQEEARLRAEEEARLRADEERKRLEAEKRAALAPDRQKELLERMNQALRAATYVGPAPSAPPAVAPAPSSQRREEKTDPHLVVPAALRAPAPSSAAPPVRQPVIFKGAGASEEADLWKLVEPSSGTAPAPGRAQNFEEALRRVDSSLEALVGPEVTQPQLVEPIIEAQVTPLTPVPAVAPQPAASPPVDPGEEARLRRQRLLKRAMENMGSLPRAEPRPTLEETPIVSTASRPALDQAPVAPTGSRPALGGAPAAPTGSRPAMASTPSMADLQLSTQIEARFSRLGKVDPFTTLGLQPTASKEQIKAAYLSLAKTFHPDRLPPSLPHLAQKMSAVFESIRQAYETLFDDARRSAYLAQRPAGGAAAQPGTPSAQAQELLKLGEAFFKKRDYRQAEQHFARAYAADPSATALAAQAWAVYMDPTRKAEVPQAREMMQRALSLDPHSDRANYQLGVIARVEGNMELAERHFREAVRVNPRHLEATQELRLIDLRKKRATEPPKKGGGFFG